MNIVIFTSNHYRHKYFVNQIAKEYNVIGVVSEEKSFNPINYANNNNEKSIITKHFSLRDLQGKKEFDLHFNSTLDIKKLQPNQINSEKVHEFLNDKKIDYIFVFGSGIIGENIINRYKNRIINMHLGLSPFYRGSGTNFFPIVNNEPEYCGVTIHFLDSGIDSGDIISRGRAKIYFEDDIHSFGCRTIKVGVKLICQALTKITDFNFKPLKQDLSIGRIYYRKDFNAKKVKVAYDNIKKGLFRQYYELQYKKLNEIEIYDT